MVMKKINMVVALVMLLMTSIANTKNEQVEACIVLYDIQEVFSSDYSMRKVKYSERISIVYGTTKSYYNGGASMMIPKSMHVDEAYIVGFEQGIKAMVDEVSKDPIRAFFVQDKNFVRALINCYVDYDRTFVSDKNNKIKLDVRAVFKASSVDFFSKHKVQLTLQQKVMLDKHASVIDIFFEGYQDGAQAVFDFVSTDSLGVIHYQFYLQNLK